MEARSLNHQTAREVPRKSQFLNYELLKIYTKEKNIIKLHVLITQLQQLLTLFYLFALQLFPLVDYSKANPRHYFTLK